MEPLALNVAPRHIAKSFIIIKKRGGDAKFNHISYNSEGILAKMLKQNFYTGSRRVKFPLRKIFFIHSQKEKKKNLP